MKATKQAKELLIEQRKSFEETKTENAKLNVQINLLREEMAKMRSLIPKDVTIGLNDIGTDINAELTELLDTPLSEIELPVRATNILLFMGVNKFVDIPKIANSMSVLKVRNSGRKTVHDISCLLEDFQLTYGMTYTDIVDTLKNNDWHAAKRKWIKESEDNDKIKENRDIGIIAEVENPESDSLGEDAVSKTETEKQIQEDDHSGATVVLTRDLIEAARTPNGGFTKSQLAAIGIDWPPPQDWIEEKTGMMITPAQLEVFNRVEYVKESPFESFDVGSKSYKEVASNSDEKIKMEAILQAMNHFWVPATPRDIARTISRTAWGDDNVRVDTVDSFLKRLPEVEYVRWGKYILKSKNK